MNKHIGTPTRTLFDELGEINGAGVARAEAGHRRPDSGSDEGRSREPVYRGNHRTAGLHRRRQLHLRLLGPTTAGREGAGTRYLRSCSRTTSQITSRVREIVLLASMPWKRCGLFVLAVTLASCGAPQVDLDRGDPGCPRGMARIDPRTPHEDAYCIDRFEASLVSESEEAPFSPFEQVKGRRVKAVSRGGVVPQAYLSRNEADAACKASRKRLCTEHEWRRACEGAREETFPYGNARKAGYCNDSGRAPLPATRGSLPAGATEWDAMNDPRLNQLPSTVAKTGSHPRCRTSEGVYDMVGNLHEWVADPGGTFLGGYYLDTKLNGDGCHYKTVAHDAAYHDYSTGFRCCAAAL
jgi:sulfatase modifying factor 1